MGMNLSQWGEGLTARACPFVSDRAFLHLTALGVGVIFTPLVLLN